MFYPSVSSISPSVFISVSSEHIAVSEVRIYISFKCASFSDFGAITSYHLPVEVFFIIYGVILKKNSKSVHDVVALLDEGLPRIVEDFDFWECGQH